MPSSPAGGPSWPRSRSRPVWTLPAVRAVLVALERHGLVEESAGGYRLTPLGRAPSNDPSHAPAGSAGESGRRVAGA